MMQTNALYFGDNLKVLSERLPDGTFVFPSESVDLVYLDPPFNSNRDYNLIFKEQGGARADAQIRAFEDSWHWDATARDIFEAITTTDVNEGRIPDHVARLLESLVRGIGHNDMSAYLVMMTPRLVQLYRVLKKTGTLYLHCDPTASHYLRVVLDSVFGPERFGNEIIWRRSNPKSHATVNFPNVTDIILRYTRSARAVYHQPYGTHDPGYTAKAYRFSDAQGAYRLLPLLNPNKNRPNLTYEFLGVTRVWRWTRDRMQKAFEDGLVVQTRPGAVPQYKKYLKDSLGRTVSNLWTDIEQVDGNERLDYPTQKPLALLERIIEASTDPGDVVLDPFCGCGTALIAAEKLRRRWVGIDVTHLSIAVMRARLMDSFALADVPVHGVPADLESARMLAAESTDGRYEFQWWALSKVDATPLGGERRKGADRGIDGVITFTDGMRSSES